jgi:hypothetical protein
MLSSLSYLIIGNTTLVLLGILASAIAPLFGTAPALAQQKQTNFSDVEPSYWAQPFIQRLATENIISGYPDGTFRPEQALARDEFAAIIRDAFSKNSQRQIPSGSVFKDVPSNYWAASAIEEAYEAKFMSGFPGGYFRPREEVSRVQAIVSLVNGLNLSPQEAIASPQQTTNKVARKPILPPLGITSLMQPVFMASRNLQAISTSTQTTAPSRPPSFIVSNYYQDAKRIPHYAVDEVATATKANIVVNYPNAKILNPNKPLNRGAAAAIIYQTLVNQGKLPPIPSNTAAYKYIVHSVAN